MDEVVSKSFETEIKVIKEAFFLKKNEDEVAKRKCPYQVTLLLSIVAGIVGFDRFYLGKIGTGILKAITFGGFGIWWIIDIFLLLFNKQKDVLGQELEGADEKEITVTVFLTLFGLHYFYLGLNKLGFVKIGILFLSFVWLVIGIDFVSSAFFLVYLAWVIFDLFLIISGRITHDINGTPLQNSEKKHQSIALIFSFAGGLLGLDRFYLGHRTLGMFKLFTFGGFYMWYVVDILLIILNALKDVDGNALIQE